MQSCIGNTGITDTHGKKIYVGVAAILNNYSLLHLNMNVWSKLLIDQEEKFQLLIKTDKP